MVCLYCGTKLAILNRMSGGAFCSLEHRSQFLAHQDSVMLGRLKEQAGRLQKQRNRIPDSILGRIKPCSYISTVSAAPSQELLPQAVAEFTPFPAIVVAAASSPQASDLAIRWAPFRFARLDAGNPAGILVGIAAADPHSTTPFFPVMRHAGYDPVPRRAGRALTARPVAVGPRTVNPRTSLSPAALMSTVLTPATPHLEIVVNDLPAPAFLAARIVPAFCGTDIPTGLEPLSFALGGVMAPGSRPSVPHLAACRQFARLSVRMALPRLNSLKPAGVSDWSVEEPASLPSPSTSPLVFTPGIAATVPLPVVTSVPVPGTRPIASIALVPTPGAPVGTLHPKTGVVGLACSQRIAEYRFFARSGASRKFSRRSVAAINTEPRVFAPSMRLASPRPGTCGTFPISLRPVHCVEKLSKRVAPLASGISIVGPGINAALAASPMPAMAVVLQKMPGPRAIGPRELSNEEPVQFERKTLKPDFDVVSVRSQVQPPQPRRGFWGVPMPAQRVLMALPILMALTVYFLGGKASTAAARKRPLDPVSENFSAGLKSWKGADGWSKTWKFDPQSGAEPGPLALLTSTTPFTDYELDFRGSIEKKSIGFAVRAEDLKNYYAVKISYRKTGRNPGLYVVRYPVIAGKSGKPTEVPLRVELNPAAELRVKLDVSGDTYTLSVGDQVADSWNDARLTHGAIGFFAARDERFRVQNIVVIPE